MKMVASAKMTSLRRTARLAGVLILLLVVIAPLGMMIVPSTLVVPGDAIATADKVRASEGLLRLGIVSEALTFLLEIAIVVLLYVLLEPVNRTLSLMAASARLAMTVLQGVNVLNYVDVLLLLDGSSYLGSFEPGQADALMLLSLNAHDYGSLIWGFFFGLHLLILGYLVYRSRYIPSLLGIALFFASLCYLVQSFGIVLLPRHEEAFAVLGFLSIVEVVFPLWMVIKGVSGDVPEAAVAAS
jgi:hypothetical protein